MTRKSIHLKTNSLELDVRMKEEIKKFAIEEHK